MMLKQYRLNFLWFLNFFFLSFIGFAYGYPTQPVWSDNMAANFEDQEVVVLWRGLHFLKEHFPNAPARDNFWNTQDVDRPMYATETYRKAGIPLGTTLTERQEALLATKAKDVQAKIHGLQTKGPVTINHHEFETYRYAFQHTYSNDYTTFHRMLSNGASYQYQQLVSGLNVEANPFASCSMSLPHSCRYGFGMKYYGENVTTLSPSYTATGKPHNPFLGVLYGVVLNADMAAETLPFNVPLHHDEGHVTVKTHFTCNILTEEEVSLVGRVPPHAVVLKYPLTVPSFEGAYEADYRELYGLTSRRYSNIKNVLTDHKTPPNKKREKVNDMMTQMIQSPRRDKGGYHRFTLSEKIHESMTEKLDTIGATERIIDLNGTIDTDVN